MSHNLQHALPVERDVLQSKGVFIPMIRLPRKGSESQPQQRQSPEPKLAEPPLMQLKMITTRLSKVKAYGEAYDEDVDDHTGDVLFRCKVKE